jgi:hypothetical protein
MADLLRANADWREYRRYIVSELSRLSRSIRDLERQLAGPVSTSTSDIRQQLGRLTDSVDALKRQLAAVDTSMKEMVKQEDFKPYKMLLNAFIGMVLVAVVSAFLTLVVRAPPIGPPSAALTTSQR